MCQACNAAPDQGALEIIEEYSDSETFNKVQNVIESGRQAREEGIEMSKESIVIIRGLEQQYGVLQQQQKQIELQKQVIQGKMNRLTEASLAEIRIVLAGNGVAREDMGKWKLKGNRIKYKP